MGWMNDFVDKARKNASAAAANKTPDLWDDPRFTSMRTDVFKSAAENPYARRFMNPGGDPELFNALREQGSRSAAGRRRSATLGLRARGANSPSSYAFAQLSANLQGESDLAGTMADARATSIGENRRFTEGLIGAQMNQDMGIQSERRTAMSKATDRMWEYKYWLEQQKQLKKMQEKKGLFGTGITGIGIGDYSMSFA